MRPNGPVWAARSRRRQLDGRAGREHRGHGHTVRAPSRRDRTARAQPASGIAVALTAALGFGGAAAIDQFALAAPDLTPVADLGPAGDGLTRLVRDAGDGQRQRRRPRGAAGHRRGGLRAAGLRRIGAGGDRRPGPGRPRRAVRALDVQPSLTGTFSGRTVSDRTGPATAHHLANTGTNAYSQNRRRWRGHRRPDRLAGRHRPRHGPSRSPTAAWTRSHPTCKARCGPTRTAPPTPTATAWSATATAGTSTRPAPTWRTPAATRTAPASLGTAAARAGNGPGPWPARPPTCRSCRSSSAYGSTVDVTAAAAAIHYAVDHGANVINASWGGPGRARRRPPPSTTPARTACSRWPPPATTGPTWRRGRPIRPARPAPRCSPSARARPGTRSTRSPTTAGRRRTWFAPRSRKSGVAWLSAAKLILRPSDISIGRILPHGCGRRAAPGALPDPATTAQLRQQLARVRHPEGGRVRRPGLRSPAAGRR